MKIGWRIVASVALVFFIGWTNLVLTSASTILAGQVAARQFEASDAAYLVSQAGIRFYSGLFIPWIVGFLTLLWIWWKPMKSQKKNAKKVWQSLSVVALAIMAIPAPSKAYYDKSDYTEAYFILPNESAFYIPDVGDNKSSQAEFGSEAYYKDNKIAAKRFVIPHVKLEGSGLMSNYYVPAGRLIIVNRAPVSLEWVSSPKKGSSPADESFPCQSREGLNITVGMAIGVSVAEKDAANYLYHFGVAPLKGNRDDPVVTFQSVLQSRSLFDVMTHVGRNKVQALVCNEFTNRSFDDGNSQALQIMSNVREAAAKYFSSVGITLEYLGWADTMNFDQDVQNAINLRYTNEKLRPVLDVMLAKAQIDTMQKWNGVIPSFSGLWVLPHDMITAVTNWFSSPKAGTK